MKMNKLLIISTLLLMTFVTFGQKNKYSDYLELNVKGEPKRIIEVSLYSFEQLLENDNKHFLDSSLNSIVDVYECNFNTDGLIVKEFFKNVMIPEGQIVDHSIKHISNYQDSIVILDIFENGSVKSKTKKILNKDGYLISLITFFPKSLSIIERDSINRKIKEFTEFIGVDTKTTETITYSYNYNNDIISKIVYSKNEGFLIDNPIKNTTEITFDYIYDFNGNWVFRTEWVEDKLTKFTERIIEY